MSGLGISLDKFAQMQKVRPRQAPTPPEGNIEESSDTDSLDQRLDTEV